MLVQGDIILSINGSPVASHAEAAKAIKAIRQGDIVIKVLAKKPRGTAPGVAEKEANLAATRMQATIRGQQSRKAADAVDKMGDTNLGNLGRSLSGAAITGTSDFFNNIKTSVQGAASKVQDLANPNKPNPPMSAEEAAIATADEREAATKMQATIRGQQSRKAKSNSDVGNISQAGRKSSFGERARSSAT